MPGTTACTGKEIGLLVDRHRPVIEGLIHLQRLVPLIIGGIVDQHRDRPVALAGLGDAGFQPVDISDVAAACNAACCRAFSAISSAKAEASERCTKATLAPCMQEALGQRRTDARPATGDEDAGVLEIRIVCVEFHQGVCAPFERIGRRRNATVCDHPHASG
jgi:hypothetical protein